MAATGKGKKRKSTKTGKKDLTPKQFARLYDQHHTYRAVAKAAGITYGRAFKLAQIAIGEGLLTDKPETQLTNVARKERRTPPTERVKALETPEFDLPPRGKINRYYLSCAQNNTKVFGRVWRNLLALVAHNGERSDSHTNRLMISRVLYVKKGLGASGDKAQLVKKNSLYTSMLELWWDKKVLPYLHDSRAALAPGLVWCGEQNILPTAVRPLSGFESYTARQSGIFPHVKLAMESVASGKNEATKFNYTTGTLTLRNYIQRKAGLKAEFHHCYGALIVEVDHDGNWFVRQLNADSEGTIYDLDVRAKDGKVTTGHRAEGISWGDVHVEQVDDDVKDMAWGDGGMLDTLRPRYQFGHDVFDFRTRNHHERYDPHKRYKRYIEGQEDVAEELNKTGAFIADTMFRPWCETVIVESNHDNMLERWLRDDPGWYAKDPRNAEVFLDLQLAKYRAMRTHEDFLLIEHALNSYSDLNITAVRFLREDESFIICPNPHGGIECGMHGHLGPNGTRGNANSFARMGRKAVTGHTHSAGIVDGVYTSGTCAMLPSDWSRGPSSHSHSHTVVYKNGKRAIYTMYAGKWRG